MVMALLNMQDPGRTTGGKTVAGSFRRSASQVRVTHQFGQDRLVGFAAGRQLAALVQGHAKQASLLIFEVLMDTFFVCTMSVLLVLVTGTWTEGGDSLLLIQASLGKYFPHMDLFMPFLLTLLGYSVISTYFSTGMYTIRHLLPGWGPKIFYAYAITAFLTFTFVDCSYACSVMAVVGACLLALNAAAIWKLRDSISFAVASDEAPLVEVF